jgi:hypothetical protein
MKGDGLDGSQKSLPHTLPKFDFESESPYPQNFSSTFPTYLLTLSPHSSSLASATTTPTEHISTLKPKSSPNFTRRIPKLTKPNERYPNFQEITSILNKTPVTPNVAEGPSSEIVTKDEIPERGPPENEDFRKGAGDFEIVKKEGKSERNGAKHWWEWRE